MKSKTKPKDNQANIVNPNYGTTGVSDAYAKATGNRGKQLSQIKPKKK